MRRGRIFTPTYTNAVFSDISRGYLLDQKSFASLTDSFFTNVKAVRGGGAGARDFVHPVPADCPPYYTWQLL